MLRETPCAEWHALRSPWGPQVVAPRAENRRSGSHGGPRAQRAPRTGIRSLAAGEAEDRSCGGRSTKRNALPARPHDLRPRDAIAPPSCCSARIASRSSGADMSRCVGGTSARRHVKRSPCRASLRARLNLLASASRPPRPGCRRTSRVGTGTHRAAGVNGHVAENHVSKPQRRGHSPPRSWT